MHIILKRCFKLIIKILEIGRSAQYIWQEPVKSLV